MGRSASTSFSRRARTRSFISALLTAMRCSHVETLLSEWNSPMPRNAATNVSWTASRASSSSRRMRRVTASNGAAWCSTNSSNATSSPVRNRSMRYPSSTSIAHSVARSVVEQSIEHVARGHQAVGSLLGERLREEEALRVLASERLQPMQLAQSLHPLGHDLDAEVVGQRDDGLHQLTMFVARIERGHEGAVDLQRVDRKVDEIGQRRIASAEVVDAKLDAELLHALEELRGA